jgi:AcrR family transcriptional regulator
VLVAGATGTNGRAWELPKRAFVFYNLPAEVTLPKVSPAHEQKRRDQILVAAMACFSRQGYRATSMEDIVHESGLSVGAIYTYYPSKEDLFLALAEQRTEQTLESLRVLFAQPGELGQKLALAVDFFFGQLEDDLAPLARVGMEFWSESSRSQKVRDSQCERMDSIRRFLQRLMAEAQTSGEVRAEVDVEASVELLMALHDGMLAHHSTGLQPISRARLKRAYADLVNGGIANPSRPFVNPNLPDASTLRFVALTNGVAATTPGESL